MGLSVYSLSLVQAMIGLCFLTLVIWLLMVITRIPAMSKARIDPQSAAHTRTLQGRLPDSVMQVSDNYNHFFEAPTVFYAISVAIVLLGKADWIDQACAWSFVGLRVAHSAVQVTFNRVTVRFILFALSWIVLGMTIVRAALTAFSL